MTLNRVTLDASVVVSASFPAENASKTSRHLIELLVQTRAAVILPTLIRPEIVAAVSRSTGDPGKAKALEESLSKLPRLFFQHLDDRIADAAVEIAMTSGLRGADAVYAATARHFDATLITLDDEQRYRSPSDVPALYPAEAIEAMKRSRRGESNPGPAHYE